MTEPRLTHLEQAKVHLREAQLWTHVPRDQQILWAIDEIIRHLEQREARLEVVEQRCGLRPPYGVSAER